jgi:hypothetical protein
MSRRRIHVKVLGLTFIWHTEKTQRTHIEHAENTQRTHTLYSGLGFYLAHSASTLLCFYVHI